MSWAASAWAKTVRTGSTSRKVVLLCLAERADSDTATCFPAQATIADEAEVSIKTVERALADLQAAGLIERKVRRRADGSRTTDLITLIGFRYSKFYTPPLEMPDPSPEPNPADEYFDADHAAESAAEQGANTQPDKMTGSGDISPHQPDSVSNQPDTLSGLTTFEPSPNREGIGARKDFEKILKSCYAAAGIAEADRLKSAGMVASEATVAQWIAQGADLEADVLPVVARLTGTGKRRRRIESWNYYTKAIEQAQADRLRPCDTARRKAGKHSSLAGMAATMAAETGDAGRAEILAGLGALSALTLSRGGSAETMRQTLETFTDRLSAYPPAVATASLEAWPAQRNMPAAKFFPSWAELKPLCDHRLAAARAYDKPAPRAPAPRPSRDPAVKAKFRSLVDELKGKSQAADRSKSGATTHDQA